MSSILVFDSGVGGLSVCQHIQQALPNWPIHYLADSARFPYGELESETLIQGCVSLITKAVARIQPSVVVVACNSASTLALPALRQVLDIPVVGVVPAIKPAALLSHRGVIGLLATPGTICRSYTQALIDEFAQQTRVVRVGSSELVKLAESKLSGQGIELSQVATILAPLVAAKVDVVVLGCTHFPLLADEIAQIMGAGVTLVDSGSAIARRVCTLIDGRVVTEKPPQHSFYYTGSEPSKELVQWLNGLGFLKTAVFAV